MKKSENLDMMLYVVYVYMCRSVLRNKQKYTRCGFLFNLQLTNYGMMIIYNDSFSRNVIFKTNVRSYML